MNSINGSSMAQLVVFVISLLKVIYWFMISSLVFFHTHLYLWTNWSIQRIPRGWSKLGRVGGTRARMRRSDLVISSKCVYNGRIAICELFSDQKCKTSIRYAFVSSFNCIYKWMRQIRALARTSFPTAVALWLMVCGRNIQEKKHQKFLPLFQAFSFAMPEPFASTIRSDSL